MKKTVPKALIGEFFRLGGNGLPADAVDLGNLELDGHPLSRVAARVLAERDRIAGLASDAVCRAYDYAGVLGEDAPAKCRRDLGYIMNYVALAMALRSPQFLEDRMLYWFERVLEHLSFPQQADSVRAAYTILRQETLASLQPEERGLASPYFDRILNVICRDSISGATTP